MKCLRSSLTSAVLVLGVVGCTCTTTPPPQMGTGTGTGAPPGFGPGTTDRGDPNEAATVAAIKAKSGWVQYDANKATNSPVVEVTFRGSVPGPKPNDADMEQLAGLKQMRKLEAGSPDVTGTGLAPLAALPNLEELDMSFGGATDEGMKTVTKLKQIKRLSVLNARNITDAGLKTIATMSNLRDLDVGQNSTITDTGIIHLTKMKDLEKLAVTNTSFSERALEYVVKMPNLRSLKMYGTHVPAEALSKLLPTMPKIEELDLNWHATDKVVLSLGKLKTLKRLDVSKTTGGVSLKAVEELQKQLPDCSIKAR
jgi:Leucine-rich repeat (LRR) protein